MRESSTDLRELRDVLRRSYRSAGAHLRSIFDEQHRVSADELVRALDRIFEMHLATVAGNGSPLVAPIDGVLFKGRICFGLPAASVRARLVRRDPRVSASYTNGPSFAFVVHGNAHELDSASEEFGEYESLIRELYVARYGPGWIDWYDQQHDGIGGAGFTGYIVPRLLFAKH